MWNGADRSHPPGPLRAQSKQSVCTAILSQSFTHQHQMSCIYLEITSGTAWGLMNSKTARKSVTVFSVKLSAAFCLFILCCQPPPHITTARQRGPWMCTGCVPPPSVSFADPWLTVRMSQIKAISLTAWLLFQGNADLLCAPRLPALPLGYSQNHGWYWAVCLPFVLTLGHAVARENKKKRRRRRKKEIQLFFFSPRGNIENYFCNPHCGNFGEWHTKNWIKQFKRQARQEWESAWGSLNLLGKIGFSVWGLSQKTSGIYWNKNWCNHFK